jgi:hypothetical protein
MSRLLLPVLLLLSVSTASAQEFELRVDASLPKDPSRILLPVFFGYDPAAADSMEPTQDQPWKNVVNIPGLGDIPIQEQDNFYDSGDPKLFLTDPDTVFDYFDRDIQTRMDIRHKPDTTSFKLRYVLWVDPSSSTAGDERMTLKWDKSTIPDSVSHIVIYYSNGDSLIDMKFANQITIRQDSMDKHSTGLVPSDRLPVVLYFNQAPHQKLSVTQVAPGIELALYPNPATELVNVRVSQEQPRPIAIELFDMRGTLRYSTTSYGLAGDQEFSISRSTLGLTAGAYFLRVRTGDSMEVIQVVFE